MIGQKLAHYEIVEKLGEGGMGEVYKARDHHLDRYIALKLLRSDKLIDADRRRRFVLEAKAASALNHPNIVTIHDIGQADGVDFISMEYVKGRTLHAAAGRRGLPLAEVLKVGMQIADAVAAAHAAGIVHRDLKPANVMLGEQGVVKVLDFGLAKLTEAAPRVETDATRTIGPAGPGTEEGYIVGTVAYMAPEQIEGGKIDARADIFAFGALLYEMITGRRAFERESRIATLSAILKDPPPPVAEAAKDVPPELERIVARCLRKDPDRRYQSMRDVRNALEEVKEDSESGRLPSGALPKPAASSSTSAVRAAAVLVLLAAAAGGAWWWTSRGAAAPPELTMRQLTADSGLTTTPAISADGKLVAYASDRATQRDLDIWVQPLAQGAQPIRLTRNEADDLYPSFSPDGGLIVFRSNRDGGGVYLVPALGGEERLLARGGRSPRFSPDGKWVVYQLGRNHLSESGIYVVSTAGGSSRRLASDVPWAAAPVFSPDGRHVLFTGAPSENPPTGSSTGG